MMEQKANKTEEQSENHLQSTISLGYKNIKIRVPSEPIKYPSLSWVASWVISKK